MNRRRLGYVVTAAEEWPIGRTPPKVRRAQKERLGAKLRATLEEDSESDIEAILDSHYPLSPAPFASQSSPSPSSIIESKFAIAPRGFEFDSETDVEAMKRDPKQMEEANDHAGDTERMRKKAKAGDVPGVDDEPKISMVQDSEAYGRYS
ncbi:hypothetical protein LA080_006744 [Diaporthe eres]|nr:hypothetical protein LA080_006744 [Diaporthe eres]